MPREARPLGTTEPPGRIALGQSSGIGGRLGGRNTLQTVTSSLPDSVVSSDGKQRPTIAPLIGLSASLERARFGPRDQRVAFVRSNYVRAVIEAGGCPVLLPPSPSGLDAVLGALDGLVITGGTDVDPSLYGADPHPATDIAPPERDAWELALCRGALERDLPLLAICRGIQVLNVSLGGTLHQHLPDVVGSNSHAGAPGQMTRHRMALKPGSALASILGAETFGLCHHHQAVDRLGKGLEAVGFAGDGTLEAAEVPGQRFAVAVQWHPEDNPADNRLFDHLVQSATRSKPRSSRDRE